MPLDPLLDVVRALAGTELDNPKVGEAVLVKRIFFDDGFDEPSIPADGDDNAAVSWDLSARHQEIAGGVVLLQEHDVGGHVGVNFREARLVDKLNDKHRRPA